MKLTLNGLTNSLVGQVGEIIDYFKLINKPSINNIELTGNKTTSDLGLIDNTVNDLLNYYLKSETYSKTEVNTIVSNINQFRVLRLDVRPEVGEEKIIYLIPKAGGVSPDIHDEWLWINNAWELIGNTQIDLSEYAKTSDVNNSLALKQDKTDNSLTTTDKTIVGAVNEVNSNKSVKPVITTYTVDTPVWTNQPTTNGSLDLTFVDWNTNCYYVTLKDASGRALPSGQFKLTLTLNGFATAINQIFSLTSLNTGNSGLLIENELVEFKTIGTSWTLRHAYGNVLMPSKSFNRKITVVGIFINKKFANNYIYYKFTNSFTAFTTMSSKGSQSYPNSFYIFPTVPFATDYKYSAISITIDMVNAGNCININCQYTAKQGKTRDQWFTNAFDGTGTQEAGRTGYIIKKDLTLIVDGDLDTPILNGIFGNGTIIRVEDY